MKPAQRRQVASPPSSSLAVKQIDSSTPTQCRFCRVTYEGETTITRQRRFSLLAWYSLCVPGITRMLGLIFGVYVPVCIFKVRVLIVDQMMDVETE